MKQEKSKYFFDASLFLLAGIFSIIRTQPMEIIVSFLFCGIFVALGFLSEKVDQRILTDRYDLEINE